MTEWTAAQLLHALGETTDCVTVAELARRSRMPRRAVVRKIDVLRRRGWTERVRTGCYRLTKQGHKARDMGARATSGPTGRHSGRRKPMENTFRVRLWRALRQVKKATIPDLIELAGKGDERDAAGNARRYLRALRRAGYVTGLARKEPGTKITSTGFTRYLLVKNTGPAAPVWNSKHGELYDPNTGEVQRLGGGETLP